MDQKPRGSVMLHGHSHGKQDEYNAQSMDLRFDVGERVIASTVSVDEYFDEMIDKVRQDYSNL